MSYKIGEQNSKKLLPPWAPELEFATDKVPSEGIEFNYPNWGPYIFDTKVDNDLIKILLEKGNESKKKNLDYRTELAGQIDYEYYYEDWEEWFIPKFEIYINSYLDTVTEYLGTRSAFDFLKIEQVTMETQVKFLVNWHLDSMWVNFQKQHEYNPPHEHDGHLSFVIYLQVPKEIGEEKPLANNQGPGRICFDYGEKLPFSINNITKLPEKGNLIIFPAWLTHYAHSFKSDVERISVSGNIRLFVGDDIK